MTDNTVSCSSSWLTYIECQALLEQSPTSVENWNQCYEFIKANNDTVAHCWPDLFKYAIIDMCIDAEENFRSVSNIRTIVEAQKKHLVTSVIISISENHSQISGYSLYGLIVQVVMHHCRWNNVQYIPSAWSHVKLISDVAATMETLQLIFPQVKNILFEAIVPGADSTCSNKAFRYMATDIDYFGETNIANCKSMCTEAYNGAENSMVLGAAALDQLCNMDCSFDTVTVGKYRRLVPSDPNRRYRYLLYYPYILVVISGMVSPFVLFQVVP